MAIVAVVVAAAEKLIGSMHFACSGGRRMTRQGYSEHCYLSPVALLHSFPVLVAVPPVFMIALPSLRRSSCVGVHPYHRSLDAGCHGLKVGRA